MHEALHAFADAPVTDNLLRQWHTLIEHVPVGIYICDRTGRIIRYNEHAASLWGAAAPIGGARTCGSRRAYDAEGWPMAPEDSPVGRVLRTARPDHRREMILERTDGERIAILANADPLFDDDGTLAGAVTCIQDVPAKVRRTYGPEMHAPREKPVEDSLVHLAPSHDEAAGPAHGEDPNAQRNQLRALLDALPAAIYTTDSEGTITFFNQACVRTAGRTPRLGKDKWCVSWKLYRPDGAPLAQEDWPMAVALKENRALCGGEIVAERPDGVRVPIIPYPTPIRDASGRLIGAINMLVDVSERKQAEFRQRSLLDELNHRVKNNLQMLCALLRAAERESGSREARIVLQDAAYRVGAMAAAQRVLYSAGSATSFDTGEFLRAVCQTAQQAFAGDVRISVQANAGELSNEISMPLALILNELLTNAVRHGLNGRRGCVKVQLARKGERMELAVEDDGGGFELTPSARRSSGLGLVAGLARQLGGTFDVERPAGARCIVTFPEQRSSLH